jgi:hypothetical protein
LNEVQVSMSSISTVNTRIEVLDRGGYRRHSFFKIITHQYPTSK